MITGISILVPIIPAVSKEGYPTDKIFISG